MTNQINRPAPGLDPVMTMITQGRRALGEDWRKIVIRPTPEGDYDIENEATEAPADKNPILVPGMGNVSVEMADFILESSRDRAIERAVRPRQSQKEINAEVNKLWHDYVEQRLRHFKGQTTIGPGGMQQREGIRHGR